MMAALIALIFALFASPAASTPQQNGNGPRGSLDEHSHHAATSAGSQCIACHAPQIARQIAHVNVRSHTFKFISPAMTEEYKVHAA